MSKTDKEALKAYILTYMLIPSLDELDSKGYYVKALKNKGNMFKKELEKTFNIVFDGGVNESKDKNGTRNRLSNTIEVYSEAIEQTFKLLQDENNT